MRCSVGAAGVAVVQIIIDMVGAGLTFAMLASLTALLSPLLVIEWYFGGGWRTDRRERLKAKEEQKKAVDAERGRTEEKR